MTPRPNDYQEAFDPELARRLQEAAADLGPGDSVFVIVDDGTLWEISYPDEELDRLYREYDEELERLRPENSKPVRRRQRLARRPRPFLRRRRSPRRR